MMKILKYAFLVCFVGALLVAGSKYLMGIHSQSINKLELGMVKFGLGFAVVRVIAFGSLFTVGWNLFDRYVAIQTGIELRNYRWRFFGWYIAIEAVILIQLYGAM